MDTFLLFMTKTLKSGVLLAKLRSTVRFAAPGPLIVMSPSRLGNFVARSITPLMPAAKLMVPPPAVFASVIAWRKEPGPESLVLLTVKVPSVLRRARFTGITSRKRKRGKTDKTSLRYFERRQV